MTARAFVAVLCVLLANVDISQQQVFLNQIADQIVAEGTDILLSLQVAPTITEAGIWYKDNAVIGNIPNKRNIFAANQLRNLFIQNVSPSDSGTYALSIQGVNSSFTFTSINIRFLSTLPTNTPANAGSDVTLQVTLSQANIQAGQWYKDGVLVNNVRYQPNVNGFVQTLQIVNALTSDSGNYEYRVYNLRSTTALLVSPAVFLNQIADQIVAEGTDILLSLQVAPTITEAGIWYKDNAVIGNIPNKRNIFAANQLRTLSIQNVSPSDSGTYALSIQGVNSSFTFTSINIRFLSTMSASTSATVGSNITLQVTLSQANIQVGQWYKDGVLVNNVRYQPNVNGFVQTLQIVNALTSDSGNYEYRVYNLRSTTALLVSPAGLFVVIGLQNKTEFEGSTITFETTLSQSPSLTGQWLRDNVPIVTNTGGAFTAFRSGNIEYLTIFNAQVAYSGLYEYRNGIVSTSAYLTVVIPQNLFIRNGLQNITVPVGDDATFQLQLSRTNVDFGVWRKGQTVLQNTLKTVISTLGEFQQLRITSATLNDAGIYSYTVNEQQTFGFLNVQQALSIDLGLRNITVLAGSTVRFTATLSIRGVGTGVWTKDGIVLPNNTRTEILVDGDIQRLTIYNVVLGDIGSYTYTVNGQSTTGYLNVIAVQVNGNWGEWSAWTTNTCENTCGNGTDIVQIRIRACDNPSPSNGGQSCPGSTQGNRVLLCDFTECPVDGRWTPWTQWAIADSCSVSCGVGTQRYSRSRNCIPPQFQGNDCVGSSTQFESRLCTRTQCPINGNWGEWSAWTTNTCANTCGNGTDVVQIRTRACDNPSPTNGGQNCPGSSQGNRVLLCDFTECPVDGRWTPWTQWAIADSCSVSCGVGTQRYSRSRNCIPPQFQGNDCVGSSTQFESRLCTRTQCPINGNWGEWSAWTTNTCANTCGNGTDVVQIRTRACDNPSPTNGGQNCPGSSQGNRVLLCDFTECPVDGRWTPWTQWAIADSCSVSCGVGTQRYSRSRNCIPPQFQGNDCVGSPIQFEPRLCNRNQCPIDGQWREWSQWSVAPCSVSCGDGIQFYNRSRTCVQPQFGGQGCVGSPTEALERACRQGTCPVDGRWTVWEQWTAITLCSTTCGLGLLNRTRTRLCIPPENGGQNCIGSPIERDQDSCSLRNCPVDGRWTPWTQWAIADSCSVSCGVGTQRYSRSRTCTPPQFQGNECVGSPIQFEPRLCNRSQCPIDGVWRAWSQWSVTDCSVSCGAGTQIYNRSRTCIQPQSGGQACVGSPTESFSTACNPRNCPIDGVWRTWGQWLPFTVCSATCGGGIRNYTRSRQCNQPQFGGRPCEGSSSESQVRSCNTDNCPIDGVWRLWAPWAAITVCSVTCGVGNQNYQRVRTCIPPQFNGRSCQGSSTEVEQRNCTRDNCPINGNWSGWSLWSVVDCGITCGSRNDVFRNRSRECNNPPPRFGGQTCLGVPSQRESVTCSFPSCVVDLCTNARVVGGVGYRYHPTDCDKYIQCYYNPNGRLVASYRTCPFGQFWDQLTLRCQQAYRVDCPLDQCKNDCNNNFNMLGSCRSYWQCDRNKVARPTCCGMGFSYVEGQGCQANFYCRDNCPTACADRDVCDKHPEWGNTNAYNLSVGLLGWMRATCVSGTFFDIVDCGCSLANASCQASYDLSFNIGNLLNVALSSWLSRSNVPVISGFGNFDGNSQLTADIKMPQASQGCPLIIRFRYRETVGVSGRHVLVSTSDCRRGNSLVIAVNDNDMMFELTSWYGWTVKLPIRLTGFPRSDFKTVTLMYSGYDMLVSIENARLKYTAKVMATESTIMACGLMFGTDGINTAENFRGQLDRLTIYKCNPGGLY